MREKFELSLWRDYFPTKEINIKDKYNPGSGLHLLTNEEVKKLEIGKCYYVWDDANTKQEVWYWRYPCSYIGKILRAEAKNKKKSELTINDYTYRFIDENGAIVSTAGYSDKLGDRNREIGVPIIPIREEKLNVLANEHMELFQGKIYNIIFTSKIDGTHTITFDVPQLYLDIYENKRKPNEYLDWLRMKTKIKLHYDGEWYTFIINNREEKKQKGYILYSFTADDLSVEELSKTGYTLNLTDDEETIELCGVGNIEELTTRILAGTDWVYDKKLTTANQQEYKRETKLNPLLGLYEDVYSPVMVYDNHYSPFLKKYVYKTEFYVNKNIIAPLQEDYTKLGDIQVTETDINQDSNNIPIYYTTRTQTDCAGSVKNLITNNSNFTSPKAWNFEEDSKGWNIILDGEDYCMKVGSGSSITTKNFTENRFESKPYIFKVITKNQGKVKYTLTLLNNNQVIKKYEDLLTNTDYCIYPDKNLNNLQITLTFSGGAIIKEIQFFEVALRDSNNRTLSITKANLGTDKQISSKMKAQKVQYDLDEDYTNIGNIKGKEDVRILLPNAVVEATARAERLYFIEPYKDLDEVQQATLDLTIFELNESYIVPIDEEIIKTKIEKTLSNKKLCYTYISDDNKDIEEGTNSKKVRLFSEASIQPNAAENKNSYVVYIDEFNQKYYYIVHNTVFKNKTFYLWKRIDLQYANQKRRMVTGSRSNRWNFIQDIAEKFQVYPKFLTLHNPETGEFVYKDGRPIKKVYYVDRFGDINYAGFKEGINVDSVNRKIISSDIVTKMYVNNLEADYANEGLITIQLAGQNPSKENYIYNFRHYLNTGVLDKEFSDELKQHEAVLKSINEVYLNAVEERDRLADSVNQLEGYKNTLETQLEESRTTVEDEKNKFTETAEYCRTKNNNIGIYSSTIKKRYGNPLLLSTDYEGNTDVIDPNDRFYNGFYIFSKDFISSLDNKHYTFFAERNNLSKNEIDSFKQAFKNKEGYYPIKNSKIENKKVYGSQKEFFKKNKIIEYNENYIYCRKKDNNKYEIVKNSTVKSMTDSDRADLYIYWVTSENARWWYWGNKRLFVHFNVDKDGIEHYQKIVTINLILNGKNGESEEGNFADWLVAKNIREKNDKKKTKYSGNEFNWGISYQRVIIPEKSSELNAQRAAIDDLIDGKDIGQTNLIKTLYSALIEYYDTLKKYKKAVLLVERLKKEKQSFIENFENKYSQFIKEGYWGDGQYTNNDSYYLDALSIGHDSAIPKVEYSIDVIDLSTIPYYRDYKFKIGDETFITDKDMFGVNEAETPIREKVMVTELTRQLDDNSKNKLSIRNYTSRFEDLFQRVTASVTSVEKNEADWSRAEILNSNGTIDSSLLTTIRGENSEWVNNSIGLLNSFQQDAAGILLTSQIDGNYKLKVNSTGIFLTETALKNDEWTTAISAKGINADVIKTGHLMAGKVSIITEGQPAQIWDKLGISMYRVDGEVGATSIDNRSFVRLDQYGLYMVDDNIEFGIMGNGEPWFKGFTHSQALDKIRKEAKVSITRKGFTYQSNPNANSGTFIEIGDLLNGKQGYHLYTKSEDTIKTIFKADNSGICQIAGFKFDQDKMWVGSTNTLNKAFNSKGGFCLRPVSSADGKYKAGIAMPGFKVTTDGHVELHMNYGEINGAVKISQAWVGPFLAFRGTKTGSMQNDFFYSEFNRKDKQGKKVFDDKGNRLDGGKPFRDGALKLLNREDKIYIGEFNLTKQIMASNKFNFKDKPPMNRFNKLNKDKKGAYGAIISVGDNFWMHSSGIGYMGGTIYINGTLYAKDIDANNIKLNGQDVMEVIRSNTPDVTNLLNEAYSAGQASVSVEQIVKKVVKRLDIATSPKITFNVPTIVGQKEISGPSIHFKIGKLNAYLLFYNWSMGRGIEGQLYLVIGEKPEKSKIYSLDMTLVGNAIIGKNSMPWVDKNYTKKYAQTK